MARAWADELDEPRRQTAVWSFIAQAVAAYAEASDEVYGWPRTVSPVTVALSYELDSSASELARTLGRTAATLPLEEACYQLSCCYTVMLPETVRSSWGAYYTPPALTDRLLALAAESGIDWAKASVLDPACGGGAFLLPVAIRMRSHLRALSPKGFLDHLTSHLSGLEIDPFAAWLTQVWLEMAFAAETRAAGMPFPSLVTVCDSLEQQPESAKFDLVLGNPPYGRVTLPAHLRERYKRSLYGHANLYGLFTDLALRWTRQGGIIAYVTPTSFLAGEYFKALRSLLAREAPPIAADFVTERRGVFEDVLQETMLTIYKKGAPSKAASVHYLAVNGRAEVTQAGLFRLPANAADPWLAPRNPSDETLVSALTEMKGRLADWGYKVSTGPLVWNRFKNQFRDRPGRDSLPVIWAESVTADGQFILRAEKRNHRPYFRPNRGDEWLKISEPCVLLQRTTAKEQARRLIAAELPPQVIRKTGAVIVENHLNMIKPIGKAPKIPPAVVAAVFNSAVVDRAFRCISGSVAVSAFELEALPLPTVEQMEPIVRRVAAQAASADIEEALQALYAGGGVLRGLRQSRTI
jgi:adenine-specific DNA-methyltransferase